MYVGWATLALGFITAGCIERLPRWTVISILALVGFQFIAVLGNILWGSGNWPLSLGVAMWGGPLALFAFVPRGERVFPWLMPTIFIHGIMVGFNLPNPHNGLTVNPNIAAGVLVIGIAYLFSLKRTWAWTSGWFLFLPLAFTHSRLGMLVGMALVLLLAALQPWGKIPVKIIVLLAIALTFVSTVGLGLLGPNKLADILTRLAVPSSTWWLPQGVLETPGLHNVPIRIALEDGLLAAGLWLGLTGYALTKWRGNLSAWWVLVAVALLGMLDYYVWMGHLVGVWWLCIGVLTRLQVQSQQSQSTPITPFANTSPRPV